MLLILQPFIVMFQATIVRDVQLFGLSIFEGFNIIVACASVCLTVYTHPEKKVFIKYAPYVFALGAYLLLHGYHIYQFNVEVYSAQTPNFLVETYYIFRTFIVPLLLIFNIYYSKIKKEQIFRILEILILIITSVMVVTNLFCVAQRNYSEITLYNTLSLFDWFSFNNSSEFSYYELTTKGWFLSGNEMSASLFMTFPVVLYRAYKKRDKFHYLLVVLQMMAMFMLGTKVANVGCLLIVVAFVVCWFIFKILKHKEKGILVILAISVGFAVLFPFSPVGYKIRYEKQTQNVSSSDNELMIDNALKIEIEDETEMDEELIELYKNLKRDSVIFKKLNPEEMSKEEKVFVRKYMADYCSYFGISPFITEHYNDLEHSVFWAKYIQQTPNNNYRVLKTMILRDIYANNNNPLDKYFGMGYTLNYIYTESDYTYQFYNYGIIGIAVLVVPYFCMLLYVIVQGLRHFKQMFTLECAMYAIAPLLGLLVGKFSGHVLERPFPLLVLGMLMGIILLYTRDSIKKL